MYVHCRNCGFNQDDFWSADGHNPFKDSYIEEFRDVFNDGMNGKTVEMEICEAEERGIWYTVNERNLADVDFREYLAYRMEELAMKLRNMRWVTFDEFQADTNKECPACGCSDMLSVD